MPDNNPSTDFSQMIQELQNSAQNTQPPQYSQNQTQAQVQPSQTQQTAQIQAMQPTQNQAQSPQNTQQTQIVQQTQTDTTQPPNLTPQNNTYTNTAINAQSNTSTIYNVPQQTKQGSHTLGIIAIILFVITVVFGFLIFRKVNINTPENHTPLGNNQQTVIYKACISDCNQKQGVCNTTASTGNQPEWCQTFSLQQCLNKCNQ